MSCVTENKPYRTLPSQSSRYQRSRPSFVRVLSGWRVQLFYQQCASDQKQKVSPQPLDFVCWVSWYCWKLHRPRDFYQLIINAGCSTDSDTLTNCPSFHLVIKINGYYLYLLLSTQNSSKDVRKRRVYKYVIMLFKLPDEQRYWSCEQLTVFTICSHFFSLFWLLVSLFPFLFLSIPSILISS